MQKHRDPLPLRLYRLGIALYPKSFRTAYSEQAFLAARDWHRDAAREKEVRHFILELGRDLLFSLTREHWSNLRRQIVKQPIVFHTIGLILILTLLGGGAAITAQQMLRRGANEPQQQMCDLYAAKIAGGVAPEEVIPAGHIDLADSLEPFLIFYNDRTEPLRSNAFLDGAPPVPPAGVFAHTRQYGSDTVTWQPRAGVRIALVAKRVKGARSGFLLAGRSLRVVEHYESLLRKITLIGWVCVIGLLSGFAALLNRAAGLQSSIAT